MRFRLPLTALAIGAFAAGCGAQSRQLPTQPPGANPVVTTASLTCDAASQARVREIIRQLYANNPKTRDGLLKKVREALES